jgi:hypothetical protein
MWRNTVGLIVMLILSILTGPRFAHARQPTHVSRIGILMRMTPETATFYRYMALAGRVPDTRRKGEEP